MANKIFQVLFKWDIWILRASWPLKNGEELSLFRQRTHCQQFPFATKSQKLWICCQICTYIEYIKCHFHCIKLHKKFGPGGRNIKTVGNWNYLNFSEMIRNITVVTLKEWKKVNDTRQVVDLNDRLDFEGIKITSMSAQWRPVTCKYFASIGLWCSWFSEPLYYRTRSIFLNQLLQNNITVMVRAELRLWPLIVHSKVTSQTKTTQNCLCLAAPVNKVMYTAILMYISCWHIPGSRLVYASIRTIFVLWFCGGKQSSSDLLFLKCRLDWALRNEVQL